MLFTVAVIESNPDAVVLPPKTVECRDDKLVCRHVVDFYQLSTVLTQHPQRRTLCTGINSGWKVSK